MALANRLAIIAGGLGGLGSATGVSLRAKGAKLALLYAPFESSRVDEVLSNTYGNAERGDIDTYECDITSPESVQNAFASISSDVEKNGYEKSFPSILVNSSGYVALFPFEETPHEEMIKHLHVNVIGPMLSSQAFANLFFRSKEELTKRNPNATPPPGRIVTIASQAAHVSLPNHGIYCTSKSALIGMNNCMASEWAGRGITANTVSPGVIWTEMGKKAWADKEVREEHQKAIPTGRFGYPEEIAATVSFLCQDETGHINGNDIKVDGGYIIR